MQPRKFTDLTKDEIRQLVTDMFHPKKNPASSFLRNGMRLLAYTEWEGDPELGEPDFVVDDILTLKNPFESH